MTIPKDNSQLENACKTLSVTFGDSSPRGRAKGAAATVPYVIIA